MPTDEASNEPVTEPHGEELLTFVVENQHYGVDILRVQEIRGWESVTRIPNTPDYVRGVLNLRGAIVPIIDTRTRLNLQPVEYKVTTVIVVVQVVHETGTRVMGLVVDAVSDVCSVTKENIQDAPSFGDGVDTRYLRGMATHDDALVIILDIDQLLGSDAAQLETDPAAVADGC